MAVYINGEFRSNTNGVVAIWSDYHSLDKKSTSEQTYVMTLTKMRNFEQSESVINRCLNSASYRPYQSTPQELKVLLNAMVYSP